MFSITGIIVLFSVIFSAFKIAINPGTFFFSIEAMPEPMTPQEENQFDIMTYNNETGKYEIRN